MPSMPTRAIRALVLIAALGAPAVPVAAQYATSPSDPGTSLAGALRTLSSEPRNFQALIAAGRASLDMGDTQAAAGFYGRAEEAAPQSPLPKVGIGAAMTAMGDARGAMTYFDRAQGLGAPHSLIALDRGLAFDLLGQQSKAQSDYRVAMFGAQADEARRRLALSLAISKDNKGATAMLGPLLARRDPGAVRTNAFVLALAGDRAGARRTIDAALPGAGARFEPFFRLLPALRADEKAMAVHLGEFPKDAAQRSALTERISSSPVVSIGTGVPVFSPRIATQAEVSPPKEANPKPLAKVEVRTAATEASTTPRAVRDTAVPSTSMAMSRPLPDVSRLGSAGPKPEAATIVTPKPAPEPESKPAAATDGLMPVVQESEPPEPLVPVNVGAVLNRDGEPIVTAKALVRPPPRPTPKLEIVAPPAPKPKVELAKLELRSEKAKSKPKVETAKPKIVEKAKEVAAKKKAPASPYFVQLASGANAERMGGEFKKIKTKKPALFAGRSVQVTNGKELFRLVVGPFKTRDDSGAFVNQLAKAGIDGFTYTAPDGMTFEKIATK